LNLAGHYIEVSVKPPQADEFGYNKQTTQYYNDLITLKAVILILKQNVQILTVPSNETST